MGPGPGPGDGAAGGASACAAGRECSRRATAASGDPDGWPCVAASSSIRGFHISFSDRQALGKKESRRPRKQARMATHARPGDASSGWVRACAVQPKYNPRSRRWALVNRACGLTVDPQHRKTPDKHNSAIHRLWNDSIDQSLLQTSVQADGPVQRCRPPCFWRRALCKAHTEHPADLARWAGRLSLQGGAQSRQRSHERQPC